MKNVNPNKTYSRQSFVTILIFTVILFCIFLIIFSYTGIKLLIPISSKYSITSTVSIFLILYSLLQWFFLRKIFVKSITNINKNNFKSVYGKFKKNKSVPLSRKDDTERDSYFFFYLLSMLQNEGRFLDFLSEDISSYKDAQIGIVARLIHKNCKNIINNYILFRHVVDEKEGEQIKISYGFNRKAIKLIGNVVGETPFNGIVKHRGWKLKPKKLPKFTQKCRNNNIIYPAQIEIK